VAVEEVEAAVVGNGHSGQIIKRFRNTTICSKGSTMSSPLLMTLSALNSGLLCGEISPTVSASLGLKGNDLSCLSI